MERWVFTMTHRLHFQSVSGVRALTLAGPVSAPQQFFRIRVSAW